MNEDCSVEDTLVEVDRAIKSGCRMLSIREHSEKQIRQKLAQKGFALSAINPCVKYLIKEGWLSETRFCNAFIRSRAAKGQGAERIERDLIQQNIKQSIIFDQFELEDIDWQQNCEDVLLKKLRVYSVVESNMNEISNSATRRLILKDFNKRVKLQNFLHYRGFSGQEISYSIKKILTEINMIEYQEFNK